MHLYVCKVTEEHIDSYGHVNNASYLTLCEQARWDLISSRGYTYQTIQESKKGPIVLEVNLKYLKELKEGDQILIISEKASKLEKISKLKQRIFLLPPNQGASDVAVKEDLMNQNNLEEHLRAQAKIAAEALFTFALFDLEKRKIIEPTPAWIAALD